ncbi:aromatic ring-hydroxylating dioxygenase subunit alpha [Paraburkholderia edwinii]|uniref:Aromatic ring-hydroxylating dioxygenase subunit alpha n=1 Tax=Paraburkholderia edwinii TaxID=2861782 RepID=A0ABX8V1S9_9BURK|nr:aromatic ring-hydroxylating dioxygenase subunit alpha [Paraburkholderia edwinii]QYD73542.1 aromatic ring-hydroxylating dioxygenase subunit alpha [Paraburkholderia edwinii]
MSTFEYVKDCWYPIGFSSEFPAGQLQGHKIVNRPIVMWRSAESGEVVAFDDRCCHKRFPLSQSRLLDDGHLECAYHGLCYDTSGRCVAIPSAPDKPIPPQARLSVVPVCEQDGVVWVWPGSPAGAQRFAPPRTSEVTDAGNLSIGSPEPLRVPANYLLLIENLLDITHFYPLHDGNIGDKENSRIPVELEEGDSEGHTFVRTTRHVHGYRQPPYLKEWFLYDTVERVHTHCMVTPGLTRVVMRVAPEGELGTDKERGYTLLHLHLPVDERNLVWRWNVSCKEWHTTLSDPNMPTARKVAEMFPAVVEQDQWALERQQRMMEYPDDGYSELFLKTDKALRRARQILMALQRKERELQIMPVGETSAAKVSELA